VKLPVALSGGKRANCDPLAGAISTTSREIVDPDIIIRTSADPQPSHGQLGFAIVRLHPLCEATKEITCVLGKQVPRPNLPFAHSAVPWGIDLV